MQDIKLVVNTTSLSAIFKDWQVKALALIPNGDIAPIGSRFVHEQTNNHLRKEGMALSISRASVINFLEMLRERDLIKGVLTTGKGGKRYLYKYHSNRNLFNEQVSAKLIGSLVKEYPDVNMMMLARIATTQAKNQD